MLEAVCRKCGEHFNPADEADTLHLGTTYGERCDGQGEIIGEYTTSPVIKRWADEVMGHVDDLISEGVAPATLRGWSELHSYVDANDYLMMIPWGSDIATEDDDLGLRLHNAVADEVDRRIKLRRPVDQDRIHEAMGDAVDAFWDAVVAKFPEVETGDLDPLATHQFEHMCEEVVKLWLQYNHPKMQEEQQ